MIDYYKHNILSILGKKAGSLSEMDYIREVANIYDENIDRLIAKKRELFNSEK